MNVRTDAAKYSIGIDFGTLSARAALFSVEDGSEAGVCVFPYPHGVMERALPDGTPLPPDYALQHPQDYMDALHMLVPEVLRTSGVDPSAVICIGIDFTACTVLPVKADGTPLCLLPQYASMPQAWVKLWKHHSAKGYVQRINQAAESTGETWLLDMYGGKLSPEMLLGKLLEIYEEAPQVYADTDIYTEACDWMTWQLTDNFSRSEAAAGICGCWRKREGYPSRAFMEALSPGFSGALDRQFGGVHMPIGGSAGALRPELASAWGLSPDTTVAVALVDSQAAVPGAGISAEGTMLATMGTSTVFLLLGERPVQVPGMGACSEDSILPGYFGYSAGQSCVGDHFAWVVDNMLPYTYRERAQALGMNLHEYLRSLAQVQKPGAHGLLALDWWNGNRCILADTELAGLLVGVTLSTRPEDIYRALIEATAYGARKIIDAFRNSGVNVEAFFASGGIPAKDPLMMQIYADVLNMPIMLCGSANGPALGAAVLATLAAGEQAGGYGRLEDATRAMGRVSDIRYEPIPENVAVYDELYMDYCRLHDYFGRSDNDVMKRLLRRRNAAAAER